MKPIRVVSDDHNLVRSGLKALLSGNVNGIEAARRIKAADAGIKIVIFSLNNGREYRELAQSLALDGFISKTDFTTVVCSVIEAP